MPARLLRYLTLLVSLFTLSAYSSAQTATGDVLGGVTDASGAIVPGATVTLTNTGTREIRNFTTGATGEFTFSNLQPGSYTLTVTAPGFTKYVADNIVLAAGDRTRVGASLRAGAAEELITVSAVATSLQTDSTTVGNTIVQKSIADLPINGRNFVNLVQLQAGVNPGNPSSQSAGAQITDRRPTGSISANGQVESANNFLLDGTDNNTRYQPVVLTHTSQEAIQEVRTDINLYTADTGRTAGAVINVITKSGSNKLHGSAYEFFRNNVTDARNFFAVTSVLPRKPVLQQNEYGGSLGGPIRHDKMFFFADYEGFSKNDGNNSVYTATVPTAFEQANPGNLTDMCTQTVPVVCSTTVVPTAQLDPTALGYLKLYPLPNQTALIASTGQATNNYLSNPTSRQTYSLADGRIDYHFNQNNLLWGRYSYTSTETYIPPYFPAGPLGAIGAGTLKSPSVGNSNFTTHNATFSYTHIFSSSLLLELHTAYSYVNDTAIPVNYGKNYNDAAPYLIPNANECIACSGLATLTITGYAASGDPTVQPYLVSDEPHQFGGALTWTHGKHTFKTGGALIHRLVDIIQPSIKAEVAFSGATPSVSLANFLKGEPYTASRSLPISKVYFRTYETGAFFQDDYRILPNLTLNLGARYDIFSPPNEKNGNNGNLNPYTLAFITGQTAGVQSEYHNGAPRIGFAYTPKTGTVIRGGFGLTFYPSDTIDSFFLRNPPSSFVTGNVAIATQLSKTGVPAVTIPSTTNLTGTVSAKPYNFNDAYFEQMNLLVQHDFGPTTVTVGYVGDMGHHALGSNPNYDLPPAQGPVAANTAPLPLRFASQLPGVTSIYFLGDDGHSSYNALQASVVQRTVHGLTFNFNYTWSHILDDLYNVSDGDNASFGLNPLDVENEEWGNSPLDVTNRFAGNISYELPFGKKGTHIQKALFGGFQVNGLGFWQTGLPINVSASVTQNGRGYSNFSGVTIDDPDQIAPLHSGGGLNSFFNIGAFARQTLGTIGDAHKYQVRGPHLRRGDLSLLKNIPITEKVQMQLRAECFNITNTPNFAAPGGSITGYSATPDAQGRYEATNSGGFGVISATAFGFSGRQYQFAARIIF